MNKSQELYESLLAKKGFRGLSDLLFFNKYIAERSEERRKYLVPHVHGEWADWYETSKARIKMILVPRGTFKSTFFTVGKTLKDIAASRNERILIANATLGNSQKFVGEIQDHIRKNDLYKLLYGVEEMYDPKLRWNQNEIEITGRDLGIREPTVTAVGVGGNLVSQHYSRIICDDLVNLENSTTRFQAEKVIDWWQRSFSLLDPEGEMLIIGTRWAYFELYSHILEKFKDKVDTYIRGAYNKDGSMYFPERYSKKKLQELKDLHGSYAFSAFYLNDPVDENSALIKRSQILYYSEPKAEVKEDKALSENLNIFTLVDPAVSQSARADYSSITTVGVDANNDWFVREVLRGKWTVGELIENMFAVNKRWNPITMTLEVIGLSQALLTPIHSEEERKTKEGKKDCYLPLHEIKSRPQVKKEIRIRSVLQPRFERGKIFIKRGMEDLIDELLRFPKASHDDIIDGLSDMDEVAFAPDPEEVKEKPESTMERRLRAHFNKKGHVDPVMGERW